MYTSFWASNFTWFSYSSSEVLMLTWHRWNFPNWVASIAKNWLKSSIGFPFRYKLFKDSKFKAGRFLIWFSDPLKNDNLGKLLADSANHERSVTLELLTHIFSNDGNLGSFWTFFILVEAATIMRNWGYYAKLKQVNSSRSGLFVK